MRRRKTREEEEEEEEEAASGGVLGESAAGTAGAAAGGGIAGVGCCSFPKSWYWWFVYVNLLTYVDRGVIPGASQEIDNFIQRDVDTSSPDTFLGLLQSSFIVGFSIASLTFAHLVHTHPPFRLVAAGLAIWIFALLLSGFSYSLKSYVGLLFARMLSGVGEAAFVTIVPPFITHSAGESKGMWLSIFYSCIPCGTAIGYTYGSFMAASTLTWAAAFYILAFAMIPVLMFMIYYSRRFPPGGFTKPIHVLPERDWNPADDDDEEQEEEKMQAQEGADTTVTDADVSAAESGSSGTSSSTTSATTPAVTVGAATMPTNGDGGDDAVRGNSLDKGPTEPLIMTTADGHPVVDLADDTVAAHARPSPTEEFWAVVQCPLWVTTVAGYAAYTASLIGLSTFGSSFFLGLGYFDSETVASTVFGIVVSAAGIIGTPLGGWMIDKWATHDAKWLSIRDIGKQLTYEALFGVVSMSIGAWVQNPWLSLTLIGSGACVLFACTAGINLIVMLAVPLQHQSFAIGLNTLFIHVFGDVPSPIIVGTLKDSLAPGCVGDDDESATSHSCRNDEQGLRLTMFVTLIWMVWTVVSFGAGWYIAHKRAKYDFTLVDESDEHAKARHASVEPSKASHTFGDFIQNEGTDNDDSPPLPGLSPRVGRYSAEEPLLVNA